MKKRKISKVQIEEMMGFVIILREDDTFIAWCPVLDESSEGNTPEEAKNGLRHAIKLRLQDANMPIPKNVRVEGIFYATGVTVFPNGVKSYGKDSQILRT